MEFATLTTYISGLYQHYQMMDRDEFIRRAKPEDFCPVIETETARLLMLLLRLKRPAKVLEIGTSIGYSASMMATVVREWQGRVITLECDEQIAEQARKNFEMVGVSDSIDLMIGDARNVLSTLPDKYDFIFLDPYNDLYPQLYGDCVRLLNQGGLLVADDTLLPILESGVPDQPLNDYNRLIAGNTGLESTIVCVGDGISLAVKK